MKTILHSINTYQNGKKGDKPYQIFEKVLYILHILHKFALTKQYYGIAMR